MKKQNKILISSAHGLLLFFLLWIINNTSYSTSVDEALLKKIFIVENLILPQKAKVSQNFVFINVSKDLKLIEDPKEYGSIAITDRNKLANFFKILSDNNNKHQFILCDIFFEYPAAEDSFLTQQISRCKNVLFPYHLTRGAIQKPAIKVPSALADYETYNGKFSKFRIVYKDSLKTIPLVLYEKLYKPFNLTYKNLHAFSPRYYIRPVDLLNSKSYPYFNLGELLTIASIDKSFYNDYIKNKFIVIGNFETDVHITPIGKVFGSLILINTYLSIKNGRTELSWGWFFFMILSLSITSYLLFFVEIKSPDIKISPYIDFVIHHILNNIFSFLFICTIIVFLSEFLFSITVTISPLFFYLVYMSWAIKFYNENIKKRKS